MALVESLLTAMVRANGDALVLHVGEKPYVVTQSGTIDLSTHGLNLQVMTGMLAQLIPADAQHALSEIGAVEHKLPPRGTDQFTVVAARGGDDIWIEIRRRRAKTAAPKPAPKAAEPAAVEPPRRVEPVSAPEPAIVAVPKPAPAPEPVVAPQFEPAIAAIGEPRIAAMAAAAAQPAVESGPAAGIEARAEAPPPGVTAVAPLPVEPAGPVPLADEGPRPPQSPSPAAAGDDVDDAPLTRTVRIEVPARTASARPSTVERLLRVAAARGASALFLSSQSRPYVRVEGNLRVLDGEAALGGPDVEAAVLEVVPDAAREGVRRGEPAEWIVEIADLGRIRCTSFRDHRGPGAVFLMISTRAATAEQLGLPPEVQALATEAEGLILVAGPRGGGKSTLVSGFVDLINRQRADYVITIERQLRLLHENRAALVSQREVRGSADEIVAAARAALREGPDVFVVEDLAAAELVPLVLDAAGQGVLVIASIAVPSATEAVQRVIELVPADRRATARAALADTFRGAVAQVLLHKSGGGRVAARELLLGTGAVSRLIADGQLSELPRALEQARPQGMVTFTESLVGFVQSRVVDVREAWRKAADRDRLLAGLRREGIDTSFVEHLA